MTLPLHEPADLAAELGPAERLLLVIDFDGTLAPIVDRPDQARPAPGAIEALQRLTTRTTVAMLSGRPVADLVERLPDLPLIHAGGHGAQIREPDGAIMDLIDVTTVTQTLDTTQEALERLVGDGVGWLVERKATSLAVHHRLVPEDEEEEALPRIRALMEQHHADDPGFQVVTGKAVLEMRPRSVDKGRALATIAERYPRLRAVVLGDDATDEDAFRSAVERGGCGVLVAPEERPSAATYRLADPAAVVTFLQALAVAPQEH